MELIVLLATTGRNGLPVLVGFCAAVLIHVVHRVRKAHRFARDASSGPVDVGEKMQATKERALGEWTPVKFDYPELEPSKDHFSTLKPIPYRPFKWGAYHITMGIRPLPWDEWIELDREFPQYHKVCDYRIRTSGDRLLQVHEAQPGIVDSGHAAAKEFMYEVAEYLSRRHPDVYKVVRHPASEREDENGWYGEGRIKAITVIPFGTTYELDIDEPLKVARMLMQEDFAILNEGTDGRYYLQAGALCIAGSWRLEDKIGMPLEDIHISGNVPQYQTRLQTSMGRFFRRLPVDKPVVRNNYGFQVVQEPAARRPAPAPGSLLDVDPDELAWATTMNGDEHMSEYERAKHINDQHDGADSEKVETPTTPATPAMFRLRTERQTLRRLPRTGAVVFTIRVYQTPVEVLASEPGVPGRMASAIRSWPDDVARYKARGVYESVLPYLDKCHAEQVARGIISGEEKNSTYPL
ncbi:hypothetical protein C8Q80DRAFT_1218050 [Daedaleopsis nitida]|nr:hypothetical protein C8Q80DRAFT_1218050 [Daedaleopsis nitida]